MANEIAERYGQGLFDLALEEETVEEKKQQANDLLNVMREQPDIKAVLQAVKITKQEKREFIDTVFADYLDADMRNLLKLVIDKGRVPYIESILKEFLLLANRHLGIQEVVVQSARKLSEEDISRIRDTIAANTGKTVVIENQIVPDLIAGIKVITENRVTDVTMKSKIEGMRRALLKGGQA